MTTINLEIAKKVLAIVDAGLVKGVGEAVPGKMCVEAAVCFAMGLPHGDDPECVSRPLRSLKIRLNDSNWSSTDARAKGLRRLALIQLGSRDALDDKEFVRRVVDLAIRKQVPIALRAAASVHKNSTHSAALLDAATRCEKEGTPGAAIKAKNAAHAAAHAAAAAAAHAATAAHAAAAAAAHAATAAAAAAHAANAADTAAHDAAHAATAAANAADAAADAAAKKRDSILSAFAEDVVQILTDMKAPGAQWLDLAPAEPAA